MTEKEKKFVQSYIFASEVSLWCHGIYLSVSFQIGLMLSRGTIALNTAAGQANLYNAPHAWL